MAKHDDLTRIKGIGPKTAKALRAAKITTFEKLSKLSVAEINKIVDRKIAKSKWKTDAKKFAKDRPKKTPTGQKPTPKKAAKKSLAKTEKKKPDRVGFDDLVLLLKDTEEKTRVFTRDSSFEIQSADKHQKLKKLGFTSWQLGAENARRVLASEAERICKRFPDIVSIGVGEKEIDGFGTKVAAICIKVKNKRAKNKLKKSQLIPATIKGIPTDIETCCHGRFELAAVRGGQKFKRKPLNNGAGKNGTVGVLVKNLNGVPDTLAFLTAGHVCRGGKSPNAPIQTIEMVQGPTTVGKTNLSKKFYRENRFVDVGLVVPTTSTQVQPGLPTFGALSFRFPDAGDNNQPIEKVGFGNKPGGGIIETISSDLIPIDTEPNDPVTLAENHILIKKTSGTFEKGDSGAVIVANNNDIIGVLRAISKDR